MTTESIHPSLTGPIQHCKSVRRELLGELREIEVTRWATRPGNQAWCIGELVDHLMRAEVGTSKMARKLIRGDFRDVIRPADASYFDSSLEAYPYGRLVAPVVLEPTHLPVDEAEERLAEVHPRFLVELAQFQGPDADALAAPDPATGVWFTLAGWVRLQALHEAHHLEQIRDRRAHWA